MSDVTIQLMILGGVFSIIFSALGVELLKERFEKRKPVNPLMCDGCAHHESFHNEEGCWFKEYPHTCGCKRFAPSNVLLYRANKELDDL